MARTEPTQPLIPSVLDRLIDHEPHRREEPTMGRTQILAQMKQSVARDLQNLLNTRCRATSWPEGLEQLNRSLTAYGIPDCVGINTGARHQQEYLRRMLLRAVETFEPRLFNVRVTVADTSDVTDRTLRFRIDALLRVDPAPEAVAYDSMLEPTSGDFSVRGARR